MQSATDFNSEINGGQFFVSTIIPPLNKEMICCSMHSGDISVLYLILIKIILIILKL